MKLFKTALILSIFMLCLISCGGDDEDFADSGSASGKSCESNFDCPLGYACDQERKICTNGSDSSDSGDSGHSDGSDSGDSGSNPDSGDSGDSETSGKQDGDDDPITGSCTPGKKQTCPYQGAPETENVGPCRAGIRTCKDDGSWGHCEGEVLPVNEIGEELCADGIDNDCNGIVDDGTDFDGDGHGACTDCCETTENCPNPKEAWDDSIATHICKYSGELSYICDSNIAANSTDPVDYAKAIGICNTTTEDSNEWGLIEAKISAPNGSNVAVHTGSNGLLSKLGNVIKPTAGNLMLGLSSGKVTDPFTTTSSGKTSGAPADWLAAHGGEFPEAEACKSLGTSSGTDGSVNDAVMLEMRIRVPKEAKSFSFNIYFLTREYPTYICTMFNDFFIALLDSTHTSNDPNLQNPADKNLAMDANGNPVGINLAPAGLFTQCVNVEGKGVTSCIGTTDLQGTGFESNGGTGWLTTRGNVVGGEIIKLRLAIWDLGDHGWDSLVLIDNFKWDVAEYKPGTGQY